MNFSKEDQFKKEQIIARSDKAIDELNDHSQKHEKLLKLFNSWKEEDSLDENKNKQVQKIASHG